MSTTTWTVGDSSASETMTDADSVYPAHWNELRVAVNALEAILDPDTNLLSSPVISSLQINDTSADHQYVFAVKELTADRTVTLPLLTGNDEFVFKAHTQTLTNKTLTAPVISTISNTGTLTLPGSTDTLVGRATTDTLTNKTLSSPAVTGAITIDGVQVIYLPDQTDFANSLVIGDGGANLVHNASDDGWSNIIIGIGSGIALTTANDSTVLGTHALRTNTTGDWNTAFGTYALHDNLDGYNNVALSPSALYKNTSGHDNVAVGGGSLYENTTGNYNIGIGGGAMYYRKTGDHNVAIGYLAGEGANPSNFSNGVYIGRYAGKLLSTGSNNIFIGYQAGDNVTTGADNIIIGYDIDAASATGDDQLNIGGAILGTLGTTALTLPAATDTLVGKATTDTLTNKTLTTPIVASFYQDAGKTKLMTTPDTASDTLCAIAATQTLTNKTLTTPIVASLYQDAGKTKLMTTPDTASDTLCAIAATQILTNKTLTSPTINAATLTGTIAYGDNAPNIDVKARAYLNAQQDNLTSNTWTKVLLDTESYDVGGDFASNKFTAPVSGYYLIAGCVGFVNIIADKRYAAAIYVDGASKAQAISHAALAEVVFPNIVDILYVAAASYIELYAYNLSGADTVDIEQGEASTHLTVHLLSI